jgi:uncharacterized membrane protein YraQ (UPF0718 family)
MSFWLLLGFLFSALLGIMIPASVLTRHLASHSWGSIWKASLLGVPLPLCSCSVIPTGLGLLKRGASKAATMSFITSTPQTGVESFMLAGGTLGWPFALVKALFAFLMGVVVGGLLPKESDVPNESNQPSASDRDWRSMLHFGFVELPKTLVKPYLIGIVISAVLIQWIDPGTLSNYIGHGWVETIAILVFSVPLYLCATASIPFGIALLYQGMSLGGVAVFLVAGPATNLISLMMIQKTLGKRVVLTYLAVIISGAVVLSMLINTFLTAPDLLKQYTHEHEHLGWWDQVLGVLLLGLFMFGYLPKSKGNSTCTAVQKGKVILMLDGLTCGGCIAKLSQALKDHSISYDDLSLDQLQLNQADEGNAVKIIEKCGFKVNQPTGEGCCS